MEREPESNSDQKWLDTAEADLRSAQCKTLIWTSLFISTIVAHLCISELAPRSVQIGADLLCMVLGLIFFIKGASSASDAQDAKGFLKKYRRGSENTVQGSH